MIKLPAGKYTVREREMLSGVAGAPESYFMPGNAFSNSIYGGGSLGKGTAVGMPNVLALFHLLGKGTAVGMPDVLALFYLLRTAVKPCMPN